MTALEQDIKSFADQNYPDRDLPERIKKFGEEFGELAEAIARGDLESAWMEAADCGIVLTDMVALMGKSLTIGMITKLDINKERITK